MITPMKKVYVIAQTKDRVPVLTALRELGVVHVEHFSSPAGGPIHDLEQEIRSLKSAISIVSMNASENPKIMDLGSADEILNLDAQRNQLKEARLALNTEIAALEPWGEFEPNDVRFLAHHGVHMRFFEAEPKHWAKYPSKNEIVVFKIDAAVVRLIRFGKAQESLPFKEFQLPQYGSKHLRHHVHQLDHRIAEIEARLKECAQYVPGLRDLLIQKQDELELQRVSSGMEHQEDLTYLKGYCPEDRIKELESCARQHGWGIFTGELSDGDRPPTLLRNPKWVQAIRPVLDLINVLPGYNEVDISPVFLVFFSIFFGILIGDAGYGMVFFALTLFAQMKLKNKVKDKAPFVLVYVLSCSAIIWGVMTGTFFGTLLLGKVIKPMISWLTDGAHVQMVCFVIGAVHLSIARGWQAALKMSTPFAALAEVGWIIVIWGGFFLANAMVIGAPRMGMDITKSLMVVGIGVGIVLLEIIVRSKGRLGDIGVGFILLFFSTLGACTDVVSYIRLFAVGLAGLAVADAFNEMALAIGFNGPVASLITVFILVAGHLFNIVLCCFGILVHGLRLNVLEFSGHLGLEWKGLKYQPFKKTEIVSS